MHDCFQHKSMLIHFGQYRTDCIIKNWCRQSDIILSPLIFVHKHKFVPIMSTYTGLYSHKHPELIH